MNFQLEQENKNKETTTSGAHVPAHGSTFWTGKTTRSKEDHILFRICQSIQTGLDLHDAVV